MITFLCEQVGWVLMGVTLTLYRWPRSVRNEILSRLD